MLRTNVSSARPPSRTRHGIRTAWLLIVMPRSRSMSMRSRYCARICRASTTSVSCNIRSARVDLPWSIWAMMQKLRMLAGAVDPGRMAPIGGTVVRSRGVGGQAWRRRRITPALLSSHADRQRLADRVAFGRQRLHRQRRRALGAVRPYGVAAGPLGLVQRDVGGVHQILAGGGVQR